MLPTLRSEQLVLALNFLPLRVGDIVVADVGGRDVIKRISQIDQSGFTLLGDNKPSSTDSRNYGPVGRSSIYGKVILTR